MNLPKKLYHAAPECLLVKIDDEGLRSNFGEIYAAESPAHALTFMWFRLLDHYHRDSFTELDGQRIPLPVRHNYIYVWEINTARTKAALWEPGTDHNPGFFGDATSWVYSSKEIRRGSLSKCLVFSREEIEAAAAPLIQ